MTADSRPATDAFSQFATPDADFASARVRNLFHRQGEVTPTLPRAPFAMRLQAVAAGAVLVTRVEAKNFTVMREASGSVVVAWAQEGRVLMGSGGSARECRPGGEIGLGRPTDLQTFAMERGSFMSITAPAAEIEARIARLGAARGGALSERVEGASVVGQALTRQARAALSEIAALQEAGLGPFAAAGYEELLLNLLAAALRPDLSGGHAPVVASAVMRRARDYLRERAAEAVEISQLAADLGLSMRALQQNFARAFGVSPREYLQRRRLDLARERLLAGGGAVTDIALACGFGDLSRFSARYRETFGELPSQTLRGA